VKKYSQPWLSSLTTDSVFILLPAVLPLFAILTFPQYFLHQTEVSSIWWVVLVLAIDVAHVYSTFFRFYWNLATFQKYKSHLVVIPVIGLVGGVALFSLDNLIFWRVLAYLAVFHFIRQQYGFMRIYMRDEKVPSFCRLVDSAAIYAATLYPLFYWHMYRTNEINWFVTGDFFSIPQTLRPYAELVYFGIIILYVGKEVATSLKKGQFNIPKNAIVFGTYISWYCGIVYFKGDLIFTMLNVMAHGIPYMALIYIYESKGTTQTVEVPWKRIAVFITTIFVLAYFEEGLWDILIWRDHENIFPMFSSFSQIDSQGILSFAIPLLALPQFTHYVLDGYIWKLKR